MVSAKFEPHDNWLPPCYHIPKVLDKALIHSKLPHNQFSMAQVINFDANASASQCVLV